MHFHSYSLISHLLLCSIVNSAKQNFYEKKNKKQAVSEGLSFSFVLIVYCYMSMYL